MYLVQLINSSLGNTTGPPFTSPDDIYYPALDGVGGRGFSERSLMPRNVRMQ